MGSTANFSDSGSMQGGPRSGRGRSEKRQMEKGCAVCFSIMIFYFPPLNAKLIFFFFRCKKKRASTSCNSQTKEAEADTQTMDSPFSLKHLPFSAVKVKKNQPKPEKPN